MTFEFCAGLNSTDQGELHAYGGFEIMKATGDYTGLQGSGKIDRRDTRGATLQDITQVVEGKAYHDRGDPQ